MKIYKHNAVGFAVEPEVGEVFECNERRMKCILNDKHTVKCVNCCISEIEAGCVGLMCSPAMRSDGRYVYFEEVQ